MFCRHGWILSQAALIATEKPELDLEIQAPATTAGQLRRDFGIRLQSTFSSGNIDPHTLRCQNGGGFMGFFNRLFGSSTGSKEYRQIVEQSMEELRLKTAAHDAAWRLGEAAWDVDQDAGLIVFTRPDGITATCPVQIIGTYNTADGTWLWGWDHPSVVPALQDHAKQVRAFGEKHGVEKLTTKKLRCEEAEAWEFAALACKLCNAQGAYRGPADATMVFMTFGDVQLRK
jgi:hypothetical protein